MDTDTRGLENSGDLPDRETDVGFLDAGGCWRVHIEKEGVRWRMTEGPISFFPFTCSAARCAYRGK